VEPVAAPEKDLEVDLPVTLKDLSKIFGVKANLLAKKLIDSGSLIKMNDSLASDVVELLALEFGLSVKVHKARDVEDIATRVADVRGKDEDLIRRAPVVAFLGHVDHGKTSLLDAIRKTDVAAGEAGGITQHMAAYRVNFGDKTIVFLDTPGHKAFTDMRSRGAKVTDLVVLVVAADDGVMPQTEEAISHARAAEVPILVALNKVDKPDSKPERVMQQLAGKGLNWDKWGGDTVIVKTSAITKEGIAELLEMISLVAEMEDLKADPSVPAQGTVLEAERSEGRGVVATVLIGAGTLRRGDVILAGKAYGRVRALYDDQGRPLEEGMPSMPVQVTGLNDLPDAGDPLLVMSDEAAAREIAEERMRRERQTTQREHVTLENLFAHLAAGRVNQVPLLLKVDGQGSLVAMQEQLLALSTPEVKVSILHAGVGGINESDVLLAHASDAIIIGFHVVPTEKARTLALDHGVDIRLFNIIYQALDDVRAALEGTLEPEKVEAVKAHVEIRQVFKVTRVGTIAGCFVKDGTIERGHFVRLIRNDVVVLDNGRLEGLRRFKEDVREVSEGFECGLRVANFNDYKTGDIVESYIVNLVPRKLSEPVKSL
jgi:translation initiation factor IF-2